MNAEPRRSPEIARGLAAVVRPALGAEAPEVQRLAAGDVAQVLGLDALAEAMAELGRHAGPARPREAAFLAERIGRLLDAVEREGDIAAMRIAAAELVAMTGHLRATEWGAPVPADAAGPAVASYPAHEVLVDLALESTPDLGRVRLSSGVAASLRAAIDWVGFDLAPRVRAGVHDSTLSLTAPVGHDAGIGPAAAVLAAVEGSLARETDGRWTMRLPLHVERLSYLLLRQGSLAFALPWHAVSRLSLLSRAEIAALAEPVLAPFVKATAPEGERPAALVARGLARAWVIADRLVWRIAAIAEDAGEAGPFASQARIVRVDSGEKYWVLDPAVLLRDVPAPEVESPAPRLRSGAPGQGLAPAAPAPLAPPSVMDVADVEEALERVHAEELAAAVARAIDVLRGEAPSLAQPAAPASPAPVPAAPHFFPPADEAERPLPLPLFTPHVTVISAADAWPHLAERAVEPPAGVPVPPALASAEAPVELCEAEAIPAEPAPVAITPPPAPAVLERPAVVAPTLVARALIADDSLVARVFLGHMLEDRGYVVESVADAATLWSELEHGPWALVCADFAMPDGSGERHLKRLLDFRAASREPFTFVVLTRDAGEEAIARGAGAVLHLRKPFETEALHRVIPPILRA